jgi:hypothetical protein
MVRPLSWAFVFGLGLVLAGCAVQPASAEDIPVDTNAIDTGNRVGGVVRQSEPCVNGGSPWACRMPTLSNTGGVRLLNGADTPGTDGNDSLAPRLIDGQNRISDGRIPFAVRE